MKRRLAAAALVLAALGLTGCAGNGSQSSDPAPASSVPVQADDSLFETKHVVENTELICVKDRSYSAVSCNWELWNKLHDTAK